MDIINLEVKHIVAVFGFLSIGTSLVMIFVQIFMLIALFKDTKLIKNNYVYLIIGSIGFVELIQQIIMLIGGIYFVVFVKPSFIIERILGAIMGSCYLFIAVLQLYLSLTRVNIFFRFSSAKDKINKDILIKSILILSTIYICFLIFYSSNTFRIDINLNECGWIFRDDEENYRRYSHIDSIVYLLLNLLTLVAFIAVIVKINISKSKTTTYNDKKIWETRLLELRLSFQAITHFVYTAILHFFFVLTKTSYPTYTNFLRILNLIWTLSVGCNTILNLIFVRNIRNLFLKSTFCLKNNKKKSRKVKNVVMKNFKIARINICHQNSCMKILPTES
ncbi:Hypothetical protein SRAE_2000045000 [Strongyloides ratti]|uniref:7TM GPCR, serpentine receptor class x (Srx) family-containing protein n=1 Tax=Strongyloides ratti TaxID=34506 RepID=A0A090MXP1_STRRB|nr:Hypothetical protein SRAE_2000045000 [Strongyloides ratti]CEF65774.1 Hypothetical protein SRAE_2000045000 [Strongyloides ratti]